MPLPTHRAIHSQCVLAAAASVVAVCGCASIPPPPSAPPTADAALMRMHATLACGNGIQANAKFDLFGEHGRGRGELLLFAVRPARIRLDIVSPFGVALATLTAVPVPGHVLVDLLRGEAPVLRHTPQAATITWSAQGYWVLFIPSTSDAREEIHIAPRPDDWTKPWEQQRMRVLDVRVEQQQYVLYHAELTEHAATATAGPREDPDGLAPALPPSGPPCDAEIPRKIRMEVPDPEADVRFQYQDRKWNPPLPEGTFEQPAPPGMPVEPVNCE